MEFIDFLLGTVQNIIPELTNKVYKVVNRRSVEQKDAIISVVIKTFDAITATKFHIIQNNGLYVRSEALASLYEEILKELEMLKGKGLVKEIPEFLHTKVRFWRDPEGHLENAFLLETVAKLDELKTVCVAQLKQL